MLGGMAGSPSSLPERHHSMEIYQDEQSLATLVGRMIVQAVQLDQPALVIAVPSIRDKIVRRLHENGVDITKVRREFDVEFFDSQTFLNGILVNDVPSTDRFVSIVGTLLSDLRRPGRPSVVLIYADMAGLLLRRGNIRAALALEQLWNRLARDHAFSLICGYDESDRAPTMDDLQALCDEHTVVHRLKH